MAQRRTTTRPLVVILIAPGYDELAVATCVNGLRQAGLAVSLVSTAAGLIGSAHGLTIRPDELIDRRATAPLPRLLILPGPAGCAEILLADPRVHRLMICVRQSGGAVAALEGAQSVVAQAGLAATGMLTQENLELTSFLQQLMDQTLM
jgi:putative intracellular protease/amidase